MYRWGKNHKEEKVLCIYSEDCPYCGEYMGYYEFMLNVTAGFSSEMDKLVRLQQIEALIDKVNKGEPIEVIGMLLGCPTHYGTRPKKEVDKLPKRPYITIDPETLFHLNNTPISHVYLTQPIA